jgi:hypothetical protein
MRLVVQNTGGSDVNINLAGTNPSFTPPQGWLYDPTSTLLGAGGNVLAGGAVDSLLIPLHAGITPGSTRLDAVMPWTQTNSQTAGSSNTSTSGFGHIKVESNPDLQVFATASASPNPNAVNVNQAFNIQVTVKNLGGADAQNVVMNLLTDGGSTIQKPFPPIPVVPGFQTVAVLLPVSAAAAVNPTEKFTAHITSATDENSGLSTLVNYTQAADSTATVAVQTPATADIVHVRPSQPAVTRSQSTPWSVTVALHNAGQAGANLTAPKASDLDFAIAGATKLDYIVQAPTKFASGATGWTLAGGVTDSLTYTVSTTGADTGKVDIHLGVAGTDRNDPPHALSNSGATSVHVQDVAGLFIASTFPVGTFNHIDANQDIVNTGFPFEVHVTVQNAGGEDVDSVRVQLASSIQAPATPSGIAASSLKRQSIAAGASHEFIFRITTRATTNPLQETFTATVSGARSHNTGQAVAAQQAVDDKHQVTVQTRANLNLNLFVAAPAGSAGGTVGAGQQFILGARVSNLGQASLAGSSQLTLLVPGGFSNPVESLTQAFVAEDTVRWTFTAPAPQPLANFSCSISTTPNDVNTGAVAFASKATDTQAITVGTASALSSPDISVFLPAGAKDDTLSVGQTFTVQTKITAAHIKNLTATLSVPGSFSVVNQSVKNLGSAPGLHTTTFDVIAPVLTSPQDDLFVTFTALDSITNAPVPSAADTVRVTVVPRTSLSISAGVTYPPDATDKTVTVGEPFRVTATVANAPNAADIAAAGNLTINLPAKYLLANGQAQVKPFTVGAPVSWIVNAAQQPSGPDQIAITISGAPDDENSGQPAAVTTGTANIAMVTQGSAVAVTDVSSAQNVGTPVAPGGSKNLGVMAFQIAYNVTDTSVPPAEVDTIAVSIIDKGGAALGPTMVAETLKRLEIDCGSQQFEVTNPNTNPVLVSLLSGGKGFPVAPNGSVNAIVKLDLDANPRATEVRVNVRGAGMVVTDPQSNQKLGVTNAQGQALDIKSESLVILSSNFQEYAHNYPNPFSAGESETKIAYFLETPANVSIKIYDITGELVHEENIPAGDSRAQAGPQETTWDGRNDKGEVVRNGLYACVLNAGGKSAKFRIAVAK